MPRYPINQSIKIAVIYSQYNEVVTKKLMGGAVEALKEKGIEEKNIGLFNVPGAFEIPLMARKLAINPQYDAVICLGAIIKGETDHNIYIAREAARGIAAAGYESGKPVIFGVLTTDNMKQALARAGTKENNKGYEAGITALRMIKIIKELD